MTDTARLDPLLTMPGHVLRRLHQLSTAVFQERIKAAGHEMTSVQYAALRTLAEHPGIDQAGLAARIAYDRATIGGVVDRLEQKGLVERCVSPRDRRAREVRLSEQGQALFDEVRPLVDGLQDDILAGLTDKERAQFLTLGAKVIAAATRD
ncbi:MarR family winged helix-turn-helix transcriptional regulator [Mesobacterium pallidum]|uniref:MarR family winged helix-turn-helix transcriptional regulator n=1 Tax=Mesobacterium pallidum TaxID=2872037 RepID=UPI001EE34754|nr:MarR family transcriptional regulator [Mesobacterium pallidum]